MRNFGTALLLLVVSATAGGCELVGDVLEFGFWVGVIVLALVVVVIWGAARMIRGGGRRPPPRV